MKLKGKVAIIAGGTKGIGLGIALEFVREGARVVVGGTTDKTGEAAVREIEAMGGKGLFINCDVSSLPALDHIIEQTVQDFGRLDIYVANAGPVSTIPTKLTSWTLLLISTTASWASISGACFSAVKRRPVK